jgi:GNAT superfamily N-acetyltransferase
MKTEIDIDEDRVEISIIDNNIKLGYVVIDHVFNGLPEFEEYMNEGEYYDIFLSDDFYKIEHIESISKGTGSMLMKLAIDYIKDNQGISIYLNACPVKHKPLDTKQLVRFYSKFGFKIIKATDLWDSNKEMILTL